MEGFFSKKETQSSSRPDGKVYSCASCGLYKNCKSPKMKPYGKGNKRILVIGEAPGDTEDRRGHPWQGPAGRLLQHTFTSMGFNLFEDCLCVNAVNCKPPKNRKPTEYEIASCRTVIVEKTIREFSPSLIIVLGSAALLSILGIQWTGIKLNIATFRGFVIPDQERKCWILPTFHPSFILRDERKEVRTVWKQDLEQAKQYVTEPFLTYKEPEIKFITDLSQITEHVKPSLIAFDYETTGLKPHRAGHRIICASVAVREDLVYAFMMPKTRKERQPFINLLTDPGVGKMAHNMKYEHTWTRERLRVEVENWEWDSMLVAHIIDNRTGITGLKFQTYINFGIIDYSSEISPYLASKEKGGNSINQIEKLLEKPGGERKLLTYCALDSIYQYRLAMKQMKQIGHDFLPF